MPPLLYAQLPDVNVSLNSNQNRIQQVLDELSLQTGYFFTYDANLIAPDKRVSIFFADIPLQTALDSIFKNPYFGYELIDKNIVIFRLNKAEAPELQADEPLPLRIRGLVKDKESGEELPFATILLYNTSKGFISNQNGEFSFIFPDDRLNPILVISVMGYKNAYVHVNPDDTENLQIEMERDIISLQEVMIRYQNPLDIIRELKIKIPDNYLKDYSTMTAYFREFVHRSKDYITFSEAVIDIDKSPYTNYFAVDNVRINRGRKLQNISPGDSVLLKIQSGVNSVFQLDIIKNLPDFLSDDYDELYRYDYRNMVSYRNQQVYHLGFAPEAGNETAMYQGDLYINKDDLALIAAEFEVNPADLRKNPERFLIKKSRGLRIKPLQARYRVEYRNTDGHYHISMVKAEVIFRIRKKGELLGSEYKISLEMAVTNVFPGERTRIPWRERLRPGVVLSDETFSYDPAFWGEYDIIEPEATLEEALKKMGIHWVELE